MKTNELSTITDVLVEAARSTMVIGISWNRQSRQRLTAISN